MKRTAPSSCSASSSYTCRTVTTYVNRSPTRSHPIHERDFVREKLQSIPLFRSQSLRRPRHFEKTAAYVPLFAAPRGAWRRPARNYVSKTKTIYRLVGDNSFPKNFRAKNLNGFSRLQRELIRLTRTVFRARLRFKR